MGPRHAVVDRDHQRAAAGWEQLGRRVDQIHPSGHGAYTQLPGRGQCASWEPQLSRRGQTGDGDSIHVAMPSDESAHAVVPDRGSRQGGSELSRVSAGTARHRCEELFQHHSDAHPTRLAAGDRATEADVQSAIRSNDSRMNV